MASNKYFYIPQCLSLPYHVHFPSAPIPQAPPTFSSQPVDGTLHYTIQLTLTYPTAVRLGGRV